MKAPFILSALLGTLTLYGCSQGTQNATFAPVSDVLSSDQSITINNQAEPTSLDPHKVSGMPEFNILRQLLVGLTTTDRDGNTIPAMALSWETDDNQTWTFYLRDALWSNGDPVTAGDFEYSFKRLVDPMTASPYASYLADLTFENAQAIIDGTANADTLGVVALDDKTLQIHLSAPVPYLPDALIHGVLYPVHRATVEAQADAWTQPGIYVSNGAYLLDSWQLNDKITLKKNPTYFDADTVTIETATLFGIPSAVTDVVRFKAGEIDVTGTDLPPEQFASLSQEYGDNLKVTQALCTYYYEMNHQKPPFDDPRVRRALSLAVDRETISDKILGQGQIPAYRLTPPYTQGQNDASPTWTAMDKETRIVEARRLLAEAGYNAQNPLTFELLYNTDDLNKTLTLATVAFWQQALTDVNVTLVNQEWKTYLEARYNGDHQIARARWCADYNEPSSFLNIYKGGSSVNTANYRNNTFDALMQASLSNVLDAQGRADIYGQAEDILDQDTALIPVFYFVHPRLVAPYVQGYSDQDPQSLWQIKDWQILEH